MRPGVRSQRSAVRAGTAQGTVPIFAQRKWDCPPRAARRRSRRGVSLMEVLISTFVLSIGLLGLAALLPLGRFAVVETNKADYSGACGRAAMRDVEIRRMLFAGNWATNPGNGAFAIDPLGVNAGLGDLGGVLPRITLIVPATGTPYTAAQAEAVFVWKDDLSFTIPNNARTYRRFYQDAAGTTDGPTPTAWPVIEGHYSWLLTASPAATESGLQPIDRRTYNLSVVVCYRRKPGVVAEQSAAASFVGGVGLGGGTITVASGLEVKEGEWLLLCNAAVARWYRVVSVGQSPATRMTLQGPDWDVANYPQPVAVVIPTVLGVYSTVVELDNDPFWSY